MSDRVSPSDGRDPMVARALATLPVPDHAPDFWDRLETSLDEASHRSARREQVAASPSAAVAPHETDFSRPSHITLADLGRAGGEPNRQRSRFGRMARPLLVAAALVLVIAAVRVSVDDDDAVRQAATSTESGALVHVPTTLGGPANDAQATLTSFLDALGDGRIDDAAKLLGPRSEAYLAAQSGSVDAYLTDNAKDFGEWAASTDRTYAGIVDDGAGSMVIVVEGTVMHDGVPVHRIDAFPMVRSESVQTWFVEPFAFDPAVGGRIELATPAPSSGLRQVPVGQPFEVFADAPGTVRFAFALRPIAESIGGTHVDHEPVVVATVKRDGANVATWTPTAADVGDAQLLIVTFTSDTGTITTAFAARVRVS